VQAYYGVLSADGRSGKGSHVDLALGQFWGTEHLCEGEMGRGQKGSWACCRSAKTLSYPLNMTFDLDPVAVSSRQWVQDSPRTTQGEPR
jgi:hypothetical protein